MTYHDDINEWDKNLFCKSSRMMGKIHKIISTSKRKQWENPENNAHDEIEYWVNKYEENLNELLSETKQIKKYADILKVKSKEIHDQHTFIDYVEFVNKIKEFTIDNDYEIAKLLKYVMWLECRGVDAPAMLIAYSVWGSTPRARMTIHLEHEQNRGDLDLDELYAKVALGFFSNYNHASSEQYMDMCDDKDMQLEYTSEIKKTLCDRTEHLILDYFHNYFRNIFYVLDRIITKTQNKIDEQNSILNPIFLQRFINKIIDPSIVENNLWDFKKTLEFWNKPDDKTYSQHKFVEHIVGYANSNGGICIIGVADSSRQVIGINDFESKKNELRKIMDRYIERDTNFIVIKQIYLDCDVNNKKECMIVIVPQTKDPVVVKDLTDRYSYPVRLETGLDRQSLNRVTRSKKEVNRDNYDSITTYISQTSNSTSE